MNHAGFGIVSCFSTFPEAAHSAQQALMSFRTICRIDSG
jgi:hypothetical protein